MDKKNKNVIVGASILQTEIFDSYFKQRSRYLCLIAYMRNNRFKMHAEKP